MDFTNFLCKLKKVHGFFFVVFEHPSNVHGFTFLYHIKWKVFIGFLEGKQLMYFLVL